MQRAKTKKCCRRGFTLVELIIVIAILAILAAVLIPSISAAIEDARFTSLAADARTVANAITSYNMSQVSAGSNYVESVPATYSELSGTIGSFAPTMEDARYLEINGFILIETNAAGVPVATAQSKEQIVSGAQAGG